MSLYVGYAVNLDPQQMALRAPNSLLLGPGWIHGWRFTFGGEDVGWQGALPTIVEDPSASTFVMLYDLHDADARNLDSAEGFELDLYRKIHVRVETELGSQTAWAYVLQAYEGGNPRPATLDQIVRAAEACPAPPEYLAQLRAWPVHYTEDDN